MFRLTEDGKAYVCLDTGLIQGWKEADSIAELCGYQKEYDKAPSDRVCLQWLGAPVPEKVVGEALALIKHYNTFEIMLALFYNPETEDWIARVPQQYGTGAHVRYLESEDLEIPTGYYFQGTIHSHPNMGAFWSGTDTKDQGGKAGIHLVIGTDSAGNKTSSKASLFYAGKQYDADYAFLFPEELPAVREDWVDRIEDMRKAKPFSMPVTSVYTGYTSYSYSSSFPRGTGVNYCYCGSEPEYHASMEDKYERDWCCSMYSGLSEDDELYDIVDDLEAVHCDNIIPLCMLYSILQHFATGAGFRNSAIAQKLEELTNLFRFSEEPTFTIEQAHELADIIVSVLCPDLKPEVDKILDIENYYYADEHEDVEVEKEEKYV